CASDRPPKSWVLRTPSHTSSSPKTSAQTEILARSRSVPRTPSDRSAPHRKHEARLRLRPHTHTHRATALAAHVDCPHARKPSSTHCRREQNAHSSLDTRSCATCCQTRPEV